MRRYFYSMDKYPRISLVTKDGPVNNLNLIGISPFIQEVKQNWLVSNRNALQQLIHLYAWTWDRSQPFLPCPGLVRLLAIITIPARFWRSFWKVTLKYQLPAILWFGIMSEWLPLLFDRLNQIDPKWVRDDNILWLFARAQPWNSIFRRNKSMADYAPIPKPQ